MKFIKIASVLLSFGAAFVNAAAEADPQDNAPKKFLRVPGTPYVESDAEAGCIKEFYGCRDAPCCGSMECIDSSQGYQYCSHQSGGDAVEVLSIPDVESDAEAGCIAKFQSCDDAPCCGSMECFEFYAGEKKFCFPSSSGDAVEVPSIPDVESDAEAGCIAEFHSCADALCCDSLECIDSYGGEYKYCFRKSGGDAVEVPSIPDVESDSK